MSATSASATKLLERASERFSKKDVAAITKALEYATAAHAGQKRGTGEAYIEHPIAVTLILADWGLDSLTWQAALLHDVPEDTDRTLADLEREFSPRVAELVDGVTKLSAVRVPKEHINYEVENLRHLFLAMAKDLRVVLLKLADRLHNVRTMKGISPAKRPRIGRETLEIYAPLADRLGMGEVRTELDDLGFRYAKPDEYKWTAAQVDKSAKKREQYLSKVKHELTNIFTDAGIKPEINARVKNLYSLYKKLIQKERDIDKIYDLFAIRVIVPTVEECYRGMGVLHQFFQPLPHRIKDYIAVPKQNGYRSLHTTIFGPGQRLLEVQFRTPEMHDEAELGIAAHAVYAEAKRSVIAGADQLKIMQQLASWQDELAADSDLDRFKLDLFAHRIFVFTPKGALHSLPAGATAVDFAYQVHTEIGDRCRGAKVNGAIVPLEHELTNGDVVEIITGKSGGPSRDWLRFVKTGHARGSIRAHFRREGREDNVTAGHELLDAAIKRLGLNDPEPAKAAIVAAINQAKSYDDVCALVGEGVLTIPSVLRRAGLEKPAAAKSKRPKEEASKVALTGLSTLATKIAQCCHPAPPEKIVGYVTLGTGISLHRADCAQLSGLDSARILAVDWNTT